MTSGGTIARRDFFDGRGFVETEIYYGPEPSRFTPGRVYTTAEWSSCVEENLRPVGIRTYKRDDLGRALAETHALADGRVTRVLRHYFADATKRPARTESFGPDGTARGESRYEGDALSWRQVTTLSFDRERRVVAVHGRVPTDVKFAFAWKPMAAPWHWGIGLEHREQPGALPVLHVNLGNASQRDASVPAIGTFETELRDGLQGIVLPPAESVAELRRSYSGYPPVSAGEARHFPLDLQRLYGKLRPGRYSVQVWHRDPKTLET